MATIPAGGEFCTDACREKWRKHLMPPLGGRHAGISRPAPRGAVEALHRAGKAERAKRRWQAVHPPEAEL